MEKVIRIINITYGVIIVAFLLDSLPTFDIKSQAIKSSIYIGILFGTPLILVLNIFVNKSKFERPIWTTISTIMLIAILILDPMNFMMSIGAWQTQTILYQNKHNDNKTVEFQMRRAGGLGYNKRDVKVTYYSPLFMIVSKIPTDISDNDEWTKVDINTNELGLKEP